MERKFFFTVILGFCGLVAMILFLFDLHPTSLPRGKLLPPQKILGRHEGCLSCHAEVKGLSEAHQPEAIGCASCHLGDPFSLDKDKAHRGMVVVPGNLQMARQTCGAQECHREITEKITLTLMATGRGLVTVNRYVFGETSTPDGEGHLSRLGKTGADSHLRNLCAGCHLSQQKVEPEPVSELLHGGGCLACHLVYDDRAQKDLIAYKKNKKSLPKTHPDLTIKITDAHCFGCHSRSSRIATSYEGWHDTLITPESVPKSDMFRQLEDDRLLVKMPDDIHHEKGLLCIDCHSWQETMGDGKVYNHQEEQVKISCTDCHFLGEPRTKRWAELSVDDRKILRLRKQEDKETQFLTTEKENRPILNAILDPGGTPVLIGKATKKSHPLKAPLPICGNGVSGHARLTCSSCHTAWSPHCIRCHTEYDPTAEGYDHLEQRWIQGGWIESIDRAETPPGEYHADPPTLGVRGDKIDTFIPGMVLTIKKNKKTGTLFRRLYAPTASHTTSAKGRSCESCHTSSLALGYGRGTLEYKSAEQGTARWSFSPLYSLDPQDFLPRDAWIGFLETRSHETSTRSNARPLNREEQVKALQVGACLTCHKSGGGNIHPMYADFAKALATAHDACVFPKWE